MELNNKKGGLEMIAIIATLFVGIIFVGYVAIDSYIDHKEEKKSYYEIIKNGEIIDTCEKEFSNSFKSPEYTNCNNSHIYVPGDDLIIKEKYKE